jgi:hypothetical protein
LALLVAVIEGTRDACQVLVDKVARGVAFWRDVKEEVVIAMR